MSKLDWDKQSRKDKANKEELAKFIPPKKKSTLDYYLRLKAYLKKVEDQVWMKKNNETLQLKSMKHHLIELERIHKLIIKSKSNYENGALYKKVIKLLNLYKN